MARINGLLVYENEIQIFLGGASVVQGNHAQTPRCSLPFLMGYPAPLLTLVIVIATTLVILLRLFHARSIQRRQQLLANLGLNDADKEITIAGFLHPYCNAGGGGERVLWAAIAYLQRTEPHVLSVIYTGDVDPKTQLPVKKEEILKRTKERFGITLVADTVHFIHLKRRWLIEDGTWKRFTLLGQGIGTALLAVEAMWNLIPDVFIGEEHQPLVM
jgi:alpha-1,2-mannosyltransferase